MNETNGMIDEIFDKVKSCTKMITATCKLLLKVFVTSSNWADKKMSNIIKSIESMEKRLKKKESKSAGFAKVIKNIFKVIHYPISWVNDLAESVALIFDKSNNNSLSKNEVDDEKYDDIYYKDFHYVNFEGENEYDDVDAGDLAYKFKHDTKDTYSFNIFFNNMNEPKCDVSDGIKSRKKGKYIFCKEVVETIWEIRKEPKTLDNNISYEKIDAEILGEESYRVTFYEDESDRVLAYVEELKGKHYVYTCIYEIKLASNLRKHDNFNIIHKENSYFNVISKEDAMELIDDIIINNIRNSNVEGSVILADFIKESIKTIIFSVSVYFIVKSSIPGIKSIVLNSLKV